MRSVLTFIGEGRFFTGTELARELMFVRGGGGSSALIVAIALVVAGVLAAVIGLFLLYAAAEMLVALADIARSTRRLRGIVEEYATTASSDA